MLLKFRGSVGWNHRSLFQDGTHNTHPRTRRITVRSCHKTKTLKYGYCYTMVAATSKGYGVNTGPQQQMKKSEKAE